MVICYIPMFSDIKPVGMQCRVATLLPFFDSKQQGLRMLPAMLVSC